jgi:hypothetical protein
MYMLCMYLVTSVGCRALSAPCTSPYLSHSALEYSELHFLTGGIPPPPFSFVCNCNHRLPNCRPLIPHPPTFFGYNVHNVPHTNQAPDN